MKIVVFFSFKNVTSLSDTVVYWLARNEYTYCRRKALISSVHFTSLRGICSTKLFCRKCSMYKDSGVLKRFTPLSEALLKAELLNWHKFSIP